MQDFGSIHSKTLTEICLEAWGGFDIPTPAPCAISMLVQSRNRQDSEFHRCQDSACDAIALEKPRIMITRVTYSLRLLNLLANHLGSFMGNVSEEIRKQIRKRIGRHRKTPDQIRKQSRKTDSRNQENGRTAITRVRILLFLDFCTEAPL